MTTIIPQPYPLFLACANPDHPDPESTITVRLVVAWQATRESYGSDDLAPMVVGKQDTPCAVVVSDQIGPLYAYRPSVLDARAAVRELIAVRKVATEQGKQKPNLRTVP
ncbi:hypothetical protein ACGFI4_08515 [Micromonospora carbonacea]|uniref:hypothetical protein n=1 Tax=Micromonospora carbonacea TaxID=47853 RepID=UPI0037190557